MGNIPSRTLTTQRNIVEACNDIFRDALSRLLGDDCTRHHPVNGKATRSHALEQRLCESSIARLCGGVVHVIGGPVLMVVEI